MTLVVIVAVLVVALLGAALVAKRCFHNIGADQALIVGTPKDERGVYFSSRMVLPLIHHAEVMDMSAKRFTIRRAGSEGLSCKDGLRADVSVTFLVSVNKTEEDVLKVAHTIGCERAADSDALGELLLGRFQEGMRIVARRFDFDELMSHRDRYRDSLHDFIGYDLNGFVLDDVSVDELRQTSVNCLDRANILDAKGLAKLHASGLGGR